MCNFRQFSGKFRESVIILFGRRIRNVITRSLDNPERYLSYPSPAWESYYRPTNKVSPRVCTCMHHILQNASGKYSVCESHECFPRLLLNFPRECFKIYLNARTDLIFSRGEDPYRESVISPNRKINNECRKRKSGNLEKSLMMRDF